MKKTMFLMLLICSYAGAIFAQDAQIPDFKNEPMLIKKDGSLGKLEKTAGEAKTKTAGGPWGAAYGGANAIVYYSVFPGAASSVSVGSDAKFIVKLADAETDPASVFYLTKAIVHKNTREVYTKKAGGKSAAELHVDLDFEKVSPGVYKLVPKGLVAGTQYAFVQLSSGPNQGLCYLFQTK
jgi:hypothetical protein